eukprot:CCRYP_019651-RA/>CCRYP_019651-RA protein AED:0.23 eAED:0.23 QI:0/-1/0/1/-1/1/1/0/62
MEGLKVKRNAFIANGPSDRQQQTSRTANHVPSSAASATSTTWGPLPPLEEHKHDNKSVRNDA